MLAETQTQEFSRCGCGYAVTPSPRMDSECDLCGARTVQLQLGAADHLAVQDHREDQPVRTDCYGGLDECLRLVVGIGSPRLITARFRQAGPAVDGVDVADRERSQGHRHGDTVYR